MNTFSNLIIAYPTNYQSKDSLQFLMIERRIYLNAKCFKHILNLTLIEIFFTRFFVNEKKSYVVRSFLYI